jgi:hypothetical protein
MVLECRIKQVTAPVFWDDLPCQPVNIYKYCSIIWCLHLETEATEKHTKELWSFKMPVTVQLSTWCNIPEDAKVHLCGCRNLLVCHAHTTGDKEEYKALKE